MVHSVDRLLHFPFTCHRRSEVRSIPHIEQSCRHLWLNRHENLLRLTAAAPSIYWGCAGELWNPSDRLPTDWSFAGYQNGDAPLPTPAATHDIKRDFGAVGNNVTDDTAAFLKAFTSPLVSVWGLLLGGVHYRTLPHNCFWG